MTLSPLGSAAGEAAVGAVRRDPVVPQCTDASDRLLEAIRNGLVPGDPVARLLAGWLTPARAVDTARVRPAPEQPRDSRDRRTLVPPPPRAGDRASGGGAPTTG